MTNARARLCSLLIFLAAPTFAIDRCKTALSAATSENANAKTVIDAFQVFAHVVEEDKALDPDSLLAFLADPIAFDADRFLGVEFRELLRQLQESARALPDASEIGRGLRARYDATLARERAATAAETQDVISEREPLHTGTTLGKELGDLVGDGSSVVVGPSLFSTAEDIATVGIPSPPFKGERHWKSSPHVPQLLAWSPKASTTAFVDPTLGAVTPLRGNTYPWMRRWAPKEIRLRFERWRSRHRYQNEKIPEKRNVLWSVSPDGEHVLVVGQIFSEGDLYRKYGTHLLQLGIHDPNTGKRTASLSLGSADIEKLGPILHAAVSSDGKRAWLLNRKGALVWNVGEQKVQNFFARDQYPHVYEQMTLSPDGTRLIAIRKVHGEILLALDQFDTATGKPSRHQFLYGASKLSSDGKWVAEARTTDGKGQPELVFHNLATGEESVPGKIPLGWYFHDFTPEGGRFALVRDGSGGNEGMSHIAVYSIEEWIASHRHRVPDPTVSTAN